MALLTIITIILLLNSKQEQNFTSGNLGNVSGSAFSFSSLDNKGLAELRPVIEAALGT